MNQPPTNTSTWHCAACGGDEYGPSSVEPSICYQCHNARLASQSTNEESDERHD